MHPSNSEHSFVSLKFRVYQRGLLLGILITTVISLVLWAGKFPLRVNDLMIPFMLIFCSVSLLLFRTLGPRFLRPFEIIIFVLVYLFFLADSSYLILHGLQLPSLDFRNFEHWIPLIYILAFLIFPTRRAVFVSLMYLSFTVIVGVAFFLVHPAAGVDWPDLSFLIQLYASNAVYITLLYIMALLKDRYGEAESRTAEMTHLAMMDELTGVHNRRKINDLLNLLFQEYHNYGRPFSIIMLDVDDLKRVNDNYGHDAGDTVLRKVSDVLRQNVRETDHIGRWGGDEFLIFYPNTTEEQVMRLARRLLTAVRKADFGAFGRVNLSLGSATSRPKDTTESLSKRADEALYNAKRQKTLRLQV